MLSYSLLFAQDEYLQLTFPCKTGGPSFSKVHVIDARPANQTMGFVQVGAFNRIAEVKYKGNFNDSLARYFLADSNSVKSRGELVLILYELFLSEKTEYMSETGRLKLTMRLFAGNESEKFHEVISVDTVYTFDAFDATKKLLRSVSEWMCSISADLREGKTLSAENNPSYALKELQVLDSLEKLKLPVYTAAAVNAGIFYTYDQFKMNAPDTVPVFIDTTNPGNIKAYEWNKKRTKKSRLEYANVYAISDGHTTVKATTFGLYVLEKKNNDFYFTGQTSFTNMNNAAMWGVMFGAIGAAIAENTVSSHLFRFKINYLKGNSIPISRAE